MTEPTGYTAVGMVGFTDKGTYSASASYVKNDLVHYGGSIWCCLIDDTTGITPTEGVNWRFWVENSQNGISDIVNVLGAKNLLKVSATTTTTNGVTFTVNSDGSISVNGTATAKAVLVLSRQDFGTAYISTAQGGATNTSEYIISGLSRNNDLYLSYNAQTTNIVVQSGYTVDNVRIYPMIRPKNIENASWQPYTKTNKELTAEVTQNSSDIQTLSNNVQTLSNNTWQLKDAVVIPASATNRVDLNTYTTVGNYTLPYDNLVQYVDNVPSIGAFNLVVMRVIDSNYYLKQIILANNTNKIYIRSTYTGGSTWTDWNETVIDSDIVNNLNTTSSGYVLDARQGKQLKDNTWQLKDAVEIPATPTDQYNLNTYTTAGTYTCSSNAASNYIANQPNSGYAFNLVVMSLFNNNIYIKQILIYGAFDVLYMRRSYNGGTDWSDWEETALRSDRVRYLDFSIAVSASYGGKYYGETALTYPDGNTNYIPVSFSVISNTDNLPATTQLAGNKVRVYADALGSATVRVAYAKG